MAQAVAIYVHGLRVMPAIGVFFVRRKTWYRHKYAPCRYTFRRQFFLQAGNRSLLCNRHAGEPARAFCAGIFLLEINYSPAAKLLAVYSVKFPFSFKEKIQPLHLSKAERGLDISHAVVESGFGVIVSLLFVPRLVNQKLYVCQPLIGFTD